MKKIDFTYSSSYIVCDHCGEELDHDDFVQIRHRLNGQTVGIVHWGCQDVYIASLRIFPSPTKGR